MGLCSGLSLGETLLGLFVLLFAVTAQCTAVDISLLVPLQAPTTSSALLSMLTQIQQQKVSCEFEVIVLCIVHEPTQFSKLLNVTATFSFARLIWLFDTQRTVSLGGLLEIGFYHARGRVVMHWHINDCYSPDRIELQSKPLRDGSADIILLEKNYIGIIADNATTQSYTVEWYEWLLHDTMQTSVAWSKERLFLIDKAQHGTGISPYSAHSFYADGDLLRRAIRFHNPRIKVIPRSELPTTTVRCDTMTVFNADTFHPYFTLQYAEHLIQAALDNPKLEHCLAQDISFLQWCETNANQSTGNRYEQFNEHWRPPANDTPEFAYNVRCGDNDVGFLRGSQRARVVWFSVNAVVTLGGLPDLVVPLSKNSCGEYRISLNFSVEPAWSTHLPLLVLPASLAVELRILHGQFELRIDPNQLQSEISNGSANSFIVLLLQTNVFQKRLLRQLLHDRPLAFSRVALILNDTLKILSTKEAMVFVENGPQTSQPQCEAFLSENRDWLFDREHENNYTVIPFFHCATMRPISPLSKVSIVTHNDLSPARIANTNTLVKVWQGLVSLAVTVRADPAEGPSGVAKAIEKARMQLHELASAAFKQHVDVHLIVDMSTYEQRRYHYNLARSVALVYAATELLLTLDGDVFLPQKTAELLAYPAVLQPPFSLLMNKPHRRPVIIGLPTFDINEESGISMHDPANWPTNYLELTSLVSKGYAKHYLNGHPHVNFAAASRAEEEPFPPYDYFPWIEFYYLFRNEPGFPVFDTSICGRFGDRVSQLYEVYVRGYDVRAVIDLLVSELFLLTREKRGIETPEDYSDGEVNLAKYFRLQSELAGHVDTVSSDSRISPNELLRAGMWRYWSEDKRRANELFGMIERAVMSGYVQAKEAFFHSLVGLCLTSSCSDPNTEKSLHMILTEPLRAEAAALLADTAKTDDFDGGCDWETVMIYLTAADRLTAKRPAPRGTWLLMPLIYDGYIDVHICEAAGHVGRFEQGLYACQKVIKRQITPTYIVHDALVFERAYQELIQQREHERAGSDSDAMLLAAGPLGPAAQ